MPEFMESQIQVVKISIGITANALNRLFTYQIPTDLVDKIDIGSVVLVPFGKGDTLKDELKAEKQVREFLAPSHRNPVVREEVVVEKKAPAKKAAAKKAPAKKAAKKTEE